MSSPFAVMSFSQVEALWAMVTSVLKVYGTQSRGGDVRATLDTDVLQSAWRRGPPRMQGLRSNSAHVWAPEKAGVRRPILIFSPRLALGTPKNVGFR